MRKSVTTYAWICDPVRHHLCVDNSLDSQAYPHLWCHCAIVLLRNDSWNLAHNMRRARLEFKTALLGFHPRLGIDGLNGLQLFQKLRFKLPGQPIVGPELGLQRPPWNHQRLAQIAHSMSQPAINVERHRRTTQRHECP